MALFSRLWKIGSFGTLLKVMVKLSLSYLMVNWNVSFSYLRLPTISVSVLLIIEIAPTGTSHFRISSLGCLTTAWKSGCVVIKWTEDPSVFEVFPPARSFHFPSLIYCRLVASLVMPISAVFAYSSSTKP